MGNSRCKQHGCILGGRVLGITSRSRAQKDKAEHIITIILIFLYCHLAARGALRFSWIISGISRISNYCLFQGKGFDGAGIGAGVSFFGSVGFCRILSYWFPHPYIKKAQFHFPWSFLFT